MEILVFSDSHGDMTKMERILRSHSKAEVVIHCGDGERDIDYLKNLFPNKAFYNVRGNCDWASKLEPTLILNLMGKRIFVTHGHLYNAKMGIHRLEYAAREKEADILLFGHTHIAMNEYHDGLYIINPGSCHGYGATYCLVSISEKGILANIANA